MISNKEIKRKLNMKSKKIISMIKKMNIHNIKSHIKRVKRKNLKNNIIINDNIY